MLIANFRGVSGVVFMFSGADCIVVALTVSLQLKTLVGNVLLLLLLLLSFSLMLFVIHMVNIVVSSAVNLVIIAVIVSAGDVLDVE